MRDESPDAFARVVDRLLASPRYGERWARHWMDVIRYADTNGWERDEFQTQIWRYRDYLIRSFNADKPFGQFLSEQLAGDELRPGDPDALIATGYLRLGPYDSTGSIFMEQAKNRNELMTDLANTTGSAFLGLTMACANCHDHKYDPMSQADHFRLRAFFAGVERKDDTILDLPAERDRIQKHNDAIDARTKDAQAKPPATHLFCQGDFTQPREEVPPGFISALDPNPAAVAPPAGVDSSGRRSALAAWITSPENPLTGRVIVNRLWHHHFGRGI